MSTRRLAVLGLTVFVLFPAAVRAEKSLRKEVLITVCEAPTVTFSADKAELFVGEGVTLSWTASPGGTITLTKLPDTNIRITGASHVVCPAETSTHQIENTAMTGCTGKEPVRLDKTITAHPRPAVASGGDNSSGDDSGVSGGAAATQTPAPAPIDGFNLGGGVITVDGVEINLGGGTISWDWWGAVNASSTQGAAKTDEK